MLSSIKSTRTYLPYQETIMSRPTPDPAYVLRCSSGPVTCLHFSRTCSDILYSGHEDGAINVWNLETKRVTLTFVAHDGYSILWLYILNNGSLLTQGRDGVVCVWRQMKDTWRCDGSIKCAKLGFCTACLVSDADTSWIAVPSDSDSQVDVYDLHVMKTIAHLKPERIKSSPGMCMKISNATKLNSDWPRILLGYEDGSIALWDVKNSIMLSMLNIHKEAVMSLAFSMEQNKGFSGSVDEVLASWNILKTGELERYPDTNLTNSGLSVIRVRPDNKLIATGGWDSRIRLFSLKNMKPLAVLTYHSESVQCIDFSMDNLLACGSKDRRISLWNLYK